MKAALCALLCAFPVQARSYSLLEPGKVVAEERLLNRVLVDASGEVLDPPGAAYQAQRDLLNQKGVYLVGYAIECGAPDATNPEPECPPVGAQLEEIGWWFSRERVVAIAQRMAQQNQLIEELQAREPIEIQSAGVSVFGAIKWFLIGSAVTLMAGLLVRGVQR